MNLKDQLLKDHTKKNCDEIVDWVGGDVKRFKQLFQFFLLNDHRLSQRASWPVSYSVRAHPLLILPHLHNLLQKMKSPGVHNAIKRNSVRLLQDIEIPEEYEGEIIELCFLFLLNQKEAIAIKAFSISVLAKLTLKYPELSNELCVIIEDQMPHQSAAFKSRGKRILNNLSAKNSGYK